MVFRREALAANYVWWLSSLAHTFVGIDAKPLNVNGPGGVAEGRQSVVN